MYASLTFSPAGQNIAQVDNPVGRIIISYIRRFSLPKTEFGRNPFLRPPRRFSVLAVRAPAPDKGRNTQSSHMPTGSPSWLLKKEKIRFVKKRLVFRFGYE